MTFSVELTAAIVFVLIGIVWLVRLESLGLNNRERIKEIFDKVFRLEEKHDALDTRIVEKLSVIERSLAKIEGRLSIEKGDYHG